MADNAAKVDTSRVYKIVPARLWSNAQASSAFTGSADDQRDGFIHLSAAAQITGTLCKYFRNQADLLLVAFDSASLSPHLKWETSRGGELFPHYYGSLPPHLALWQRPLPLGADGLPQCDVTQLIEDRL
ncbi:MAG: DUF952 domain-containing protein [Hyphomicrobium sp.]|nr:DUF952 domain-containing protein [Hyphomicrobium sp.]